MLEAGKLGALELDAVESKAGQLAVDSADRSCAVDGNFVGFEGKAVAVWIGTDFVVGIVAVESAAADFAAGFVELVAGKVAVAFVAV